MTLYMLTFEPLISFFRIIVNVIIYFLELEISCWPIAILVFEWVAFIIISISIAYRYYSLLSRRLSFEKKNIFEEEE